MLAYSFKVNDRVRYTAKSAEYNNPLMVGKLGKVVAVTGPDSVRVQWDGQDHDQGHFPENLEKEWFTKDDRVVFRRKRGAQRTNLEGKTGTVVVTPLVHNGLVRVRFDHDGVASLCYTDNLERTTEAKRFREGDRVIHRAKRGSFPALEGMFGTVKIDQGNSDIVRVLFDHQGDRVSVWAENLGYAGVLAEGKVSTTAAKPGETLRLRARKLEDEAKALEAEASAKGAEATVRRQQAKTLRDAAVIVEAA
ncbi:hypothetical protein [Micromonospora coerulea]|uniref:hypothetical protein n=1 Tax=Micromonospora coerulea TaxID=47856 RepID=UPI001903B6DD|nr:hypothetical protein [Micromonospora veneta]